MKIVKMLALRPALVLVACSDSTTGSVSFALTARRAALQPAIATWFLNGAKTALVSPASANKGQPNESIVANNIQNSFKAFEDDDRDGLEN